MTKSKSQERREAVSKKPKAALKSFYFPGANKGNGASYRAASRAEAKKLMLKELNQ